MAIIQRWLILFSLNQAHMNGQIPVFNTVKRMTKIALEIQNKTVNAFRLTYCHNTGSWAEYRFCKVTLLWKALLIITSTALVVSLIVF